MTMTSRREKVPSRKMHRVVLVICEGETEANYVNLLRGWYKSPIKITSCVKGNRITQALVEKCKRELKISVNDQVDSFLMYDMDVPNINEKLSKCNATLLLSNPCFELWLLLHAKEQKTALSTEAVQKELKRSASVWNNYIKAYYTETQRTFLMEHIDNAIQRAKALKEFQNPSSGVYKLIEVLKGGSK
jgi:hypothetical protein